MMTPMTVVASCQNGIGIELDHALRGEVEGPVAAREEELVEEREGGVEGDHEEQADDHEGDDDDAGAGRHRPPVPGLPAAADEADAEHDEREAGQGQQAVEDGSGIAHVAGLGGVVEARPALDEGEGEGAGAEQQLAHGRVRESVCLVRGHAKVAGRAGTVERAVHVERGHQQEDGDGDEQDHGAQRDGDRQQRPDGV